MVDNNTVRSTAEVLSYVSHKIYLAGFSHGLKPAQWVALRYFSAINPTASTVTDFARQIGCTKGTASRTVNHLIRRGLLQKRDNPADKRSHFLEMTENGTAYLQRDPIELLEADLYKLSEEDRVTLQTALVRLLANAVGS